MNNGNSPFIIQDFNWFVSNYDDLFNIYGHKFLAIKDKRVLGVFDNMTDGITETSKTEVLGSFIVQECSGDSSAYTAVVCTPWITLD